ncbi:glycogen synthase GlgA [Dyella jiangningensis]|uniref:glycogen synthase GlgA n=1 Tax=Dyella jiangningensis TaxID=1379159 RepID=UPI00240FD888|nr:glycogen synthase GlgA [Dyella jiangningensis]MDG2538865.1 glycogen synthase GlgA [Dyella jiangningensis]
MTKAIPIRNTPVANDAMRRIIEHRPSRPSRPRHGQINALFVTTEMTDFVKTGGLGDVAAALPRALSRWHDVRVLIPGYPAVLERAPSLRWVGWTKPFAGLPAARIGHMRTEDGLDVYVLRQPAMFERVGSPYVGPTGTDWTDNATRFALLSMAAAQIAMGTTGMDWRPDLLHLNDWPTALAAPYLQWGGCRTPSILTIHNLAHQGLFPMTVRTTLGIPARATEADYHGQISFLRAGLMLADQVTTVSATYAEQIATPLHGMGLHALLHRRAAQGRLAGITNGIDSSWNLANDPALPQGSDRSPDAIRSRARAQLRNELGLDEHEGPVFSFVARMVAQKGIDLVCEVGAQIVSAGGQLALIGVGDADMETAVMRLARRFRGRVAACIGFSEPLARRMFAGSDFLLMPSRFEPCGLSQMYAQTYGSLPIAHATGGLMDTIEDGVTGLLFSQPRATDLRQALQRAFRIYDETELLQAMRRAAMAQRHDWTDPARQYSALYAKAVAQRAAA